jgi:hypothetical protein
MEAECSDNSRMNSHRSIAFARVLVGTLFAPILVNHCRADTASSAVEFAADVPLVESDGMPCIEVGIGNGSPVLFGIDTGDVNSVVDTRVAASAGLKLEAIPPPMPEGICVTTIPTLHIGPLTFEGRKAITMDFVKNQLPPKLSGTLAYTFFKDRVLQVDFARRRVRISGVLSGPVAPPEPSDRFSLVTFGRNGPPIVVAQGFGINGKPVAAQVDTMYTGSLLIYTASLDKLGLAAAAKAAGTEFFAFTDGGVSMRVATAESESFHGISVAGPGRRLYFPTPGVHEPDGLFDATVGLGLLRDCVLTLNFHDQTISVQKSGIPDSGEPRSPTRTANAPFMDSLRVNPILMRVWSAARFTLRVTMFLLVNVFVGLP